MDIKEILVYAGNVHGEKFSWSGVSRHMSSHFADVVSRKILADSSVQKTVSYNVKILQDINKTLDIARNAINEIVSSADYSDTSYVRNLTSLMDQYRKAIVEAEKLQSKLQIKTDLTEDQIIQLILEATKDLPLEYAKQTMDKCKSMLAALEVNGVPITA